MNLAGYTDSGVTNAYYMNTVQTMRATPTYTAIGSTNINVTGSVITAINNSVIALGSLGDAIGGFISNANGSLSAEL
jgi:hypothetical protein